MKLSSDGKTLSVDSKVMKADGGSSNDSSVYERVSGGPGLAGKWKTKNVKTSALLSPPQHTVTPERDQRSGHQ